MQVPEKLTMSAKKATNRSQTAASPKQSVLTQNSFTRSISRLSSAPETRPCETKSSKTGKVMISKVFDVRVNFKLIL